MFAIFFGNDWIYSFDCDFFKFEEDYWRFVLKKNCLCCFHCHRIPVLRVGDVLLPMSTSGNILYYNTWRKHPTLFWDTAGDIREMRKSFVALRGNTLSQ